MALSDSLKTDMSGISPLIDADRTPKETPQSFVKMPVAPKFGEDDVGTMQSQVRSGQTRLDKSYAEQERLIGETGNVTNRLYQETANLVRYKNDQELFKAKQQTEAAKKDSENITKMLDEIRGSPLYKQKQETNKQLAEYSAFVPTEVTAPMLGVLFATIGATGMLLGGNSKNTAKAALSAMNGMAEGFGKGREQYDKERKQAFDSNVKLLQTKLSAINDGLEDARKEAVLNKQAADQKVRETLAANDAQFLQENTNRRGLESTIELVKGQLASLKKSLELQKTKTNQIEGQLQRETQALDNRKIIIAHQEAAAKVLAENRAEESRQRHLDRLAEIGLTASLRPGPVPKVVVQNGQLVQLPDARTLPTANVAAPISSLGAAAKKGDGVVKPPPKEILTRVEARDSLIPSLKELLPTLDRLNKQGKYNELSLALNSPTGAEWYFKDDLDAIKAIRILAKFRGGEFETAGKSLTKREDEILRPLYQAANRPYVAVRNAVEEGLKELTQQNEGYKNAYPEFYKRQSAPTDRLAQTMDQAGATPGSSVADVRTKAQEKILEINKRTDIDQSQKQELVGRIGSLYKQKTGMDL
jgi:hypothetical protein